MIPSADLRLSAAVFMDILIVVCVASPSTPSIQPFSMTPAIADINTRFVTAMYSITTNRLQYSRLAGIVSFKLCTIALETG